MDFLNKAFAQLSDLFRSMTPAARITAGLLLVMVVVSVGYLFKHQGSSPDDDLMNGQPVPASYLPAMEAAFDKAKLNTYRIEGTRIRVPRGQRAAYMAALVDGKALPPNFGSGLREALEKGGIFDSPEQRKQRGKIALQEVLSDIIRAMKGIESAYVLYDTDTRSGLGREKLTTATVGVKPQGSEQLDAERASSIRQCVAGAIAGMKPENVTVMDLSNGRTFHGDPDSGGIAGENTYAAAKEIHERNLKSKILNALAFIPNVAVEVSVMLDPLRSSQSYTTKLEKQTVPLYVEEKGNTKSREGSSGGQGGQPGYRANANGPTALASAGGKGAREEEEGTERKEQSKPLSTDHTRKETVGLTPKSAKATVSIPSGYFEKVWHERNPVKDGEEPKTPEQAAIDQIREEVSTSVKKSVATLLPGENPADGAELVAVTTFQDIKPDEVPSASIGQKVGTWLLQNWSTLGMAGLVVLSLMVLRSMVRSVPAPTDPRTASLRVAGEQEGASAQTASAETAESSTARRLRRLSGGGPSLRDELSELVAEDPDTAASILRSWIGNAG